MVLLDDGFATIEAAIEATVGEGRGVFDNLLRFIAWTVPTNTGQGMVVLIPVLLGAALPVVPVQILWINMTTAVFPAYHWEIAGGGPVAQARTTAVDVFVCVQIAYLFSCRAPG